MSQTLNLKVLKGSSDQILLAEVAAWLHDVGKLCDKHIQGNFDSYCYKAIVDDPKQVIKLSQKANNLPKPEVINSLLRCSQSSKAADYLPKQFKDFLENQQVNIPVDQSVNIPVDQSTYSLAELIMLGVPGFAGDKYRHSLLDSKDGWLPAVLGVCHSEAHIDKEEPEKGAQSQTFISSAFGYEQQTFSGYNAQQLINLLPKTIPTPVSSQFFEDLYNLFVAGLGDTRRPVNEVTLADWSHIVAALFKSALAGAVLNSSKPGIRQFKTRNSIDHDLRWRVLRINFDVLGLYAKAVKIADLLGYQQKIEEVYKAVKEWVEIEYPLGNEILRDTTGIYFTFPDIDLTLEIEREIRTLIENIEPELAPRISTTKGNASGQADSLREILKNAHLEAVEELAQPFDDQNLTPHWKELWGNLPSGNWEVCPVCRLRPMGEGEEACKTCLNRRVSRIQNWMTSPDRTIWMDEIADRHGRVALVVGKFGLDGWFSGDLIQTLLVRAHQNEESKCIPKNPSPARLRRVWETCTAFWKKTVESSILTQFDYSGENVNSGRRTLRLKIIPSDTKIRWKNDTPYDGMLDGKPISLLWRQDHFLTISNLQWVDEIAEGKTITLADPQHPRLTHAFTIQEVAPAEDRTGRYTPFIPILTVPDQFLALIPAADAIGITNKIFESYKKEFGKVQNRLPLFLGLIFFPRKTPLLAVMDTAQRMLGQVSFQNESWKVLASNPSSDNLAHLLLLSSGERLLEWQVPVKMGDGLTDDLWYPYYFVEKFADGSPSDRSYRFQRQGSSEWLIHVRSLLKDDGLRITPSRFAYIFLENTARRFALDIQKESLLLDDLPKISEVWRKIYQSPRISDTRLQNIYALLEAKRKQWKLDEPTPNRPIRDEAYRQLVQTILKQNNLKLEVAEVLNGYFHHCVDLYLQILKRRVKDEQKNS